ncbi:histidine--tRNA ligase [Candidatus Woesearchaeota archaeon]|nr:histidine--tRNA ligase [Candidatus Woesearchaeota archaeon]
MKVQSLKGTRDFYPENKAVQNYLFEKMINVAKAFGYLDYEGPLLEPSQLWELKSGSEIPQQMYVFKDKGGRKVAIRPELTPTLARMVAAKQKELSKPLRWYSIGRFWRYEQPQSGRLREFFQFNIDCLGLDSMKADAEIIATAIELMKSYDCNEKDFYIRLGNRKLIENAFTSITNKKNIVELSRLVDKKDKISKKEFDSEAKKLGLDNKQLKELNNFLTITDLSKLKEYDGYDELDEVISLLKAKGYNKFIQLDLSIMRGFDYYTSTVFEVFDKRREFRAIAGGGRYDNLVTDFGGEKCPGVGYAFGDVVLELFLKKLGKLPSNISSVDYYITPLSGVSEKTVNTIATQLRQKYSVEVDISERNLSKMLSAASKSGAKFAVIVGEKDLKQNKVTVRDLASGKEKKQLITKLI